MPQHVTGLADVVGNPIHATGVGLLLMGSQIEHPRRPVIADRARGQLLQQVEELVSRRVLMTRAAVARARRRAGEASGTIAVLAMQTRLTIEHTIS